MRSWPPHAYLRQGAAKGVAPDLLERALSKARFLQQKDLPAILTLNHLAERVGVSHDYLRDVIARKSSPYKVFRLQKRRGGYRQICVAEPPLQLVQKWVNQNILSSIKPHPASFAYAPGSSSIECARLHCQARWLIKLDIQSFFESISEIQVYNVFRGLGYDALVAFELSRICTRLSKYSWKYRSRTWTVRGFSSYAFLRQRYSIESYRRLRIGHLPQGAPTSPMLSNLAMFEFDERLTQIAHREGMCYTRYSDDLVFSTGREVFSRKIARGIVGQVYRELAVRGFRPHRSKVVVSPPGGRKVVLGLLVDGDDPRLPREFKERLQQHLYFIEKYGVAQHAEKQRFSSMFSMRRHLEGLARYAWQVEKRFGTEMMQRLATIDWPPLPDLASYFDAE